MNNIENLLEKIKEDKLAYTFVNSIKDISGDKRPAVLNEVLSCILSKKIQFSRDKDSNNEN